MHEAAEMAEDSALRMSESRGAGCWLEQELEPESEQEQEREPEQGPEPGPELAPGPVPKRRPRAAPLGQGSQPPQTCGAAIYGSFLGNQCSFFGSKLLGSWRRLNS